MANMPSFIADSPFKIPLCSFSSHFSISSSDISFFFSSFFFCKILYFFFFCLSFFFFLLFLFLYFCFVIFLPTFLFHPQTFHFFVLPLAAENPDISLLSEIHSMSRLLHCTYQRTS